MGNVRITRELMEQICPECAEAMAARHIAVLKLDVDDLSVASFNESGEQVLTFAGFSEGLCKSMGKSEGFFTRCAAKMKGKVANPEGFCASLHKRCLGKWPAEKHHSDEDESDQFARRPRFWTAKPGPGVWRTIRGRRVFIRDGESAKDAYNRDVAGRGGEERRGPGRQLYTVDQANRIAKRVAREKEPSRLKLLGILDREGFRKALGSKKIDEVLRHFEKIKRQARHEEGYDSVNLRFRKSVLLMSHSNAIRDVPIFSAGTHNGREFTERDIDDIISAFGDLDFRPALKIGHTKPRRGEAEVGMPAFGWVTNLRKKVVEGVATLFADFESMHDSVIHAIRNRLYDRVSSELYLNLERGKKFYRRALKAVALLGAEVPAVAGLTPLHKIEFAGEGALVFSEAKLDVNDADILAVLEARVDGIETFLDEQESDMKVKDPRELTRLKLKLAEFRSKMKKLKDKDKMDDDEKKELKNLETSISELADEIAALESDDPETEKRLKKLEQENAELRADRRKDQVAQRVARCKVKSLAPTLEALFAHALENIDEKVEVFTVDKDGRKIKETKSLVAAVEDLVDQINKRVEPLFKQLSVADADDLERRARGGDDEDVGQELDEKVTALMNKDKAWKEAGYSATQKHVLANDKDLNQRYHAFLAQGNTAKVSSRAH